MGEVEDGGGGKAEAEDGSGGGEDEGFGEELADDAAASGSECGAHSELLGAGGGAGEQEVREVDADDEKNEANCSPGAEERAGETAGVEATSKRDHIALLADGVVDVRGEDVHFGAGSINGVEVEGFGEDADDGV